MKKFLAIIIMFVAMFSVGCDRTKDKEIKSIELSTEFYAETFYVGDEVDFSDYFIKINFETGLIEEVLMSSATITGFHTNSAGTREMVVTFRGESFSFSYTIHEITVAACTYKGSSLTLYNGETADFSNLKFTVLYSNGVEEELFLTQATHSAIDFNLTNEPRDLTFTYEGKSFTVPYVVTYREMIENQEYDLIDNVGAFDKENLTISINGNIAVVCTYNGGERTVINNFSITESGFNKFTMKVIKGGGFVTVELYRVGNSVYMVKKN